MRKPETAENGWQIYRCKFLIRARKLTRALIFVDALGREHRGKKGDYLVESANGAQRIWPRQLFEDAHVLLDSIHAVVSAAERSPSPASKKAVRAETRASVCGKTTAQTRTSTVNCLRYNM